MAFRPYCNKHTSDDKVGTPYSAAELTPKEKRGQKRKVENEDFGLERIDTPYGNLIKEIQLPVEAEPGVEPEMLMLKYVCPFAYLCQLCQVCQGFVGFLKEHVSMNASKFRAQHREGAEPYGAEPFRDPPARIAIYLDEVTPGNVHRPDKGRCYTAVYWTFMDFPSWFLNNMGGWFTFCFISANDLKKTKGKDSQLFRLILKAFFPQEGFNFATTGVTVSSRAAPAIESFWFRACFGCLVADADAIAKVSMWKTASGSKCCARCQNVMGRCEPEDLPHGSNLVHFTCGDYEKFIPFKPQELAELYRHLGEQQGMIPKRDFNKLQQAAGYNYSEYGILSSDMGPIANLPDTVFYDWMHTVVSNGGVAQFEINALLLRMKGLSPQNPIIENLDKFSRTITFPHCEQQAARLKFADRMNKNEGHHIRAFAAETLYLVVVLGLWCQWCLAPCGVLEEEVKCFLLLGRIVYLLRMRNNAVPKWRLLHQLIVQHHELFMKLYPEVAKPKLHYLMHIAKCIEQFGVNLSCFSMERKHKESKYIASCAFRTCCNTMLRRNLKGMLEIFKRGDCLHQFRLVPPQGGRVDKMWEAKFIVALASAAAMAGPRSGIRVAEPKMANAAKTPKGQLHVGDLIVYRADATLQAGFIEKLFMAEPNHLYVAVSVLRFQRDTIYSKAPGDIRERFVGAELILGAFPFVSEDNLVHIIVSADIV